MFFYLAPALCAQSLLRVSLKQTCYQIFGCFAHILGELELALFDILIECWNIVRKVRRLTNQELIEHCTDAIEVAFLASTLLTEHFWG
jgi:hypothetical protein